MPKDDPKLNMRLVEIKNIAINAAGVLQPWLPLVYTKLFFEDHAHLSGVGVSGGAALQKNNPSKG